MHDIGAKDQSDGEGDAREADLTDSDERPTGIAGGNSRDVAHDATAYENFDVGPGMSGQSIRAGQSDKPSKDPCSEKSAEFPAFDRGRVLGVVVGAMMK